MEKRYIAPMQALPKYKLLFFFILLLAACSQETKVDDQLPEAYANFGEFYERWHRDSAFQMEHIQFPLQGLPQRADSITVARNNFFYQEENWKIHRPVDFENSDFNREFVPLGEDILIEYILHRSGDYGMMRRWARQDGEWTLIYFADMNQIQPAGAGGIRIESGGF